MELSKEAQNLKTFRKEVLHLSQTEFAKKLDVSQSMIGNIETGLTAFPAAWIDKIKKVFNYDIEKQTYIVEKEYTTVTSNIIPIPFYHVKVAANPKGEMLPDYAEEEALYFDKRWLKNFLGINPYNCSILQAKGDSMDSGLNKSDDIRNDDLLLVDNSDVEIVNNKIYVIELTTSNEILVKKVKQDLTGKTFLISNNEKYLPREIFESDNALIKGRVVWNGSREKI